MSETYLEPAEARARYAAERGLSDLPPEIQAQVIPEFPEGTREYAEYAAKLREALADPKAVAEWVDSFDPVNPRDAGIGK
ncbi:hypothetical protein KNU02_gp68 [Gordonia phage Pleakley]|uniref:Uncharacterized protein n=1 Tax=Gordonia phage Pleakley TaxID=2283246 RepID=A0A345M6I6_9CAUD|nr:hypothetical protein KNU02_gp68 [Gordonia phage Pleakley]AXH49793.1 hypothetical protein SEA_FURY_68 [Gordonia phage Fury]AXH66107.1 hypothetical protein SEA_PLEAKLEY_68 [Gordonia phage Pleakley]